MCLESNNGIHTESITKEEENKVDNILLAVRNSIMFGNKQTAPIKHIIFINI